MTSMATGRTWRRIAGSPNALALAGALLALAAFGQAIVQGLAHTVNAADAGGSAPNRRARACSRWRARSR